MELIVGLLGVLGVVGYLVLEPGVSFEESVLNDGQGFEVSISKCVPDQSGKTILLLPPTGGENFLDRNYAGSFCKAGFQVIILQEWTGQDEKSLDLGLHQLLYERGNKAVGLVLKQIHDPFIAIFGTSVGATHAAVALASYPQIKAGFLVAGGGAFAEVIAHTNQSDLKKIRKERMEKFGFKDQVQYQAALEKTLSLDPLKLPVPRQASVGMVIATEDKMVPTSTQTQLAEYWKPSVIVKLPRSHVMAILQTWIFRKSEVVDFFEKVPGTG